MSKSDTNEILSKLSPDQLVRVYVLVDELCSWIENKGPDGLLAYALVGLRLQNGITEVDVE